VERSERKKKSNERGKRREGLQRLSGPLSCCETNRGKKKNILLRVKEKNKGIYGPPVDFSIPPALLFLSSSLRAGAPLVFLSFS